MWDLAADGQVNSVEENEVQWINEGTLDRRIRVLVGLVALPAGLFALHGLQAQPVGMGVAGLGVILLATGFIGVCPAYLLFGVSTCRTKR